MSLGGGGMYVIDSIGELAVDWLETDKAHIIQLDVPGLTKDDLSLQILAGNILHITGMYNDGRVIGGGLRDGIPHVIERPRGNFLRQYKLPSSTLVHYIEVFDDENGVITITIPKKKPYVRNIPIYVMNKL
ncbi:hypothetical protein GOP47_0009554 [Adiantum capillus-veneris]|uniref:SHSP domain-containing protein n=1 Tax=Adiantum capillus-veneris TaxID=13818 RepID=A0A9D4UWS5_ADICA|nr:hypothetical protein GOP47_0009554 [Adiantum capillus-veneris]